MTDEEIEELRKKNRELEARLDAMKNRQEEIVQLIIGPDRTMFDKEVDQLQNLMSQVQSVDERIYDVEKTATAAIAESSARADGGEPTLKDIARKQARNELVRLAATQSGTEHNLPLTKIIEQARPQHELKYQTVKDAVFELQTERECLFVTENSNGDRVLKIKAEKISRDLVVTVEQDLGRDDLTKRLISEIEQKGGTA